MASLKDQDYYLEKLHADKIHELIPVIIVILILMVIGIIGNVSVFIFYWRQTRRSSTTIFIMVLAATDIVVCFSMTLEIVDLASTYVFENQIACLLYVYINHISAMSSGLTLVIIAVDRYRKLAFRKQLTLKQTKIIATVSISIAFLLSVPVFFLYGTTEITISNPYNVFSYQWE